MNAPSTAMLLSQKDADRYFDFLGALREFTLMFENEQNERAAAIVGATFLDTMLENALSNFFVDDDKELANLLGNGRPLGTYGSRTSAAYCLGLIGPIVRDDLRLVGKIRNKFAHDLHASFDDDPIRTWTLSLKWHEISMMMAPPAGASISDIFQVGVNQLICHLHGILSIARGNKCQSRGE